MDFLCELPQLVHLALQLRMYTVKHDTQSTHAASKKALADLANVGKQALHDLKLLNITTVEELAQADPTALYLRLETITQSHHDPCVWDLFSAIIHEARTEERQPWWNWTPVRKEKVMQIPLCSHIKIKKKQ